jgi:hypothetical protein
MNEGWIKIHRKFLTWEWYDDINTKTLFLHLLIMANHEEKQWRGLTIKRGQRLTSLPSLAKETSLSVQNIRTSLKRLESTGELTGQSTNRNRLITICNYEKYQMKSQASQQANQHSTNRQLTANKNVKNKKKKDIASPKAPQSHILPIEIFRLVKNIVFENKEQEAAFYKRNVRAGKALAGFSKEQILRAMVKCQLESAEVKYDWKLETVGKKIDEYKNKTLKSKALTMYNHYLTLLQDGLT